MPSPHAFPEPNHPTLSLSAREQAARVRDGSLTSQELVELYLSRITRHDPKVGAFASTLFDSARREAEAADRARSRNATLGPLHGVPTAMKDLHFVKGSFTRMGSKSWRYLWSPFDDLTTASMRRAGSVIVGKTTTSELGLMPIVETDLHPPTRNPWDPTRTAGGSSGGAGAAIAAGLVPLAPGSDGAGSVRIPSALCGLVGMKPSRGLVPHAFARVDLHRMASIGPMARDVEDAALLLEVLTGRDGFVQAAKKPSRRLRFGLLLEPPMGETNPRIARRVQEAADTLKALKHEVVAVRPAKATLDEFLPIYQQFISRVPAPFESQLQPMTRWFRAQGRTHAASMVKARLDELTARVVAMLDGVDVLLSPTVPVLPFKVGEFAHLPPPELFEAIAPLGAFTAAWNFSGLAALTLPWGRVDGLPVGVQIVGRVGTDTQVLSLAHELEAARPEGL